MIKVAFALGDKLKELRNSGAFRPMGAQVAEGAAPTGHVEEEISARIEGNQG